MDQPVSRLLVIDDDPRFPDYLQALLNAGPGSYNVHVARNVQDGLRELSEGSADVCLLDYRFGEEEDGLDLLRRAKEQGVRTPIVLLTGEGSDTLAFSAIEQGASDYLDKSELDPRRLERTISRAIARQRAELALRDRESRLEDAEAFAHVMQAQLSIDGRWIKVPRRLCELLGYTESELIGASPQAISHPDDLEVGLDAKRRVLDGAIRSVEFEKRFICKDGRVVWMYLNCSLVVDEHGSPLCYVGFLRDISAQKRDDEARKRLEEQLRHSQKMEAIGQLAGGVAHDFNNLLTAILGYTDLLIDRCHDAPDVCADLEEIKSAGSNAAALTEQLLAFGRKQMLNPQVLSVNTAIGNMGNLLRRVLGEDIELVAEASASHAFVKVDPVQLQQVMLNLAVNARDAMKRGGRLAIETEEYVAGEKAVADGPALQAGRYVVITVEDTGSGMDPATQAHIFEPFFTTKAPGKGTGLGLATAYGIIKQSGGDIQCRSHLGVGTRFSIYLPACAEVPRRSARATIDHVKGSETILLVEDQAPLRRLTRRILEDNGYRVFDTGEAEMALHVAAGSAFDLLLTDVVMPQMTGPELARDVRRHAPDVPVLFMSGFAGHIALTDLAGAPLLSKPFTPSMLITKVRDLLDLAAGSEVHESR